MIRGQYDVLIEKKARKQILSLPKRLVRDFDSIILKLKENPRPSGCRKLLGKGSYRIRRGNYRILYKVDDKTKEVVIYRIAHRKNAYRF